MSVLAVADASPVKSPVRSRSGVAMVMRKRDWRCVHMTSAANHFGHRESGGLVVDLFWDPGQLQDEFRVSVEDRREGARFVLHPATGREAIEAYHHPFSAASVALKGKAAGIRFEEKASPRR
jgi:hypothetical protein